MAERRPPQIWVLAGTNGAGKSSVGGASIAAQGLEFFNPDEAARRMRAGNPRLALPDANGRAWEVGRRLLERAIAERKSFALETTLGGRTIAKLLELAHQKGFEVRIWFAGLASPELHLERVRSRVGKGGHDIPEAMIRKRYDAAREHLIDLLPGLAELHLYDNSEDRDPDRGRAPEPRLVLHWRAGQIVAPPELGQTPKWARPIVAAAMKTRRR
ncbi:MAG: zeta toxin family protein [Myxococcales bacterium]|nr:zeta toxin family protein [Myxococcales bacterium]